MKKEMLSLVAVTALLTLSACGDGNTENETDLNDNNLNNENIESNASENINNEENANENMPVDDNNEADNNTDNYNTDNNENNNTAADEEVAEDTEPQYELHSDFTVRPIDDADEEVVLLTIDDAPDSHAVEMAEILYELDAGAIFFVNGIFLQSEESHDELREIYEMGFEIGNHTMSHKNLSQLTEEEQYEEIAELNELIEEITGERPRFFRAPFGVNTDYSKNLIEEKGMQWMNWTYGYDYFEGYMETEPLAEIMVEAPELRNGANLLMHDREFTKEALESIVEGLREKGYGIADPKSIK